MTNTALLHCFPMKVYQLDYIETLSGEGFLNTVKSAQNTVVNAVMPKFSYDYKIKLNVP